MPAAMEAQRLLADRDQWFLRMRQRNVDVESMTAAFVGPNGKKFPYASGDDVLAAALEAVSRVCDVAVPEGLNADADPRDVYAFVVEVLIKYGEQRQEEGKLFAASTKPLLTRDMKMELQALHKQIGAVLERG